MYLNRSTKHQSHKVRGHHENEPRLNIYLFVLGSVMLQRWDGQAVSWPWSDGWSVRSVRARRGGSLCQSARRGNSWDEWCDPLRQTQVGQSREVCVLWHFFIHFLIIVHQSWGPIVTQRGSIPSASCLCGRWGKKRGRFVSGQNSTIRWRTCSPWRRAGSDQLPPASSSSLQPVVSWLSWTPPDR